MTFNLPRHFSSDLKIWNYCSDRLLNDAEVGRILEKGSAFSHSWMVHGKPLKAEVLVFGNAMVTIVVDNSVDYASGCSIDKSVAFIQALEKELNTSFMNRMKFLYANTNEEISIGDCRELSGLNLEEHHLVFNHLANNRSAFEKGWQKLSDSWIANLI